MSQIVKLRRLPHGEGLDLPAYATPGAAGFDLSSAVNHTGQCAIQPGERALIPTGFCFEVPPGHEMQVRPRSGHALKAGLMVVNSPGTVDSDFRGEVQVILYNSGDKPFIVTRGMRIAQGVIAPVVRAEFVLAEELSQTERGEGGYGSTGSTPQERFKAVVSGVHDVNAAYLTGAATPQTMIEALMVEQAGKPAAGRPTDRTLARVAYTTLADCLRHTGDVLARYQEVAQGTPLMLRLEALRLEVSGVLNGRNLAGVFSEGLKKEEW
jgi:dUTP pyrophosphatase